MRRLFAVTSVLAFLVGACTHDFSRFDAVAGDAPDATIDTGRVTTPPSSAEVDADAYGPNDADIPPGDAGADADAATDAGRTDAGCDPSCVAAGTACASACDADAQKCTKKCRNGDVLCGLVCSSKQGSCRRDCQVRCRSCGGAACNAACN